MTVSAEAASRFGVERLEGDAVRARWDAFIGASPAGSPFATTTWLDATAKVVGADIHFWVVSKGAEWVAAVAVPHRRLAGRSVHRGLPLSAYSSWCHRSTTGHPSSRAHEHLEASDLLIRSIGPRYAGQVHVLNPSVIDARPWSWRGWEVRPRYTYVLDLREELPVTDSVRRHVRKCRDAGMTSRDAWDLEAFISIQQETQGRQGFGLGVTVSDFRSLADGLHGAGLASMISVHAASGEPVGSQIILTSPGSDRTHMWLAGTRPAFLRSGASSWLMVETARRARERGLQRWDLCGADLPGVSRFKAELGGTLTPHFEVRAPRGALERALRALVRAGRRS
jgi:hypothetical protein